MKIGILTLPLHTNYGGILQAYALQTTLQKMGHEVVVIDKRQNFKLPLHKKIIACTKQAIKRYLLGKDAPINLEKYQEKVWKTRTRHTTKFIENHLSRVVVENVSLLKAEDFDAIVVGSDQIWRCPYSSSFPGVENSFLAFAETWDIKRLSYAASFGTDEWEYSKKQTTNCSRLISKFDAVSVREMSAVRICKEHLKTDAVHVIDPTMLLCADDYRALLKDIERKMPDNGLMCYVLDSSEEVNNIIKDISHSNDLTPYHTNSKTEDYNAPIEERVQPKVEDWLRSFNDAEFIVTDSFHACVFSILFKKPFIVFGNKDRGVARFQSLLSVYGLEDRLVTSYKEFKEKIDIIKKPIDYDSVHALLEQKRCDGTSFLREVLTKE